MFLYDTENKSSEYNNLYNMRYIIYFNIFENFYK